MTDIDEFWIVSWDGIPLYSYSPSEKLNQNLIGGFFSAIQAFAKEMTQGFGKEYVKSLSIGKFNYIFLSNHSFQLFFISKSNKKVKEKQISKHLKTIEKMFLEKYESVLTNFDGDVTSFGDFNYEFQNYFNDNFRSLKGMW